MKCANRSVSSSVRELGKVISVNNAVLFKTKLVTKGSVYVFGQGCTTNSIQIYLNSLDQISANFKSLWYTKQIMVQILLCTHYIRSAQKKLTNRAIYKETGLIE